MTDTLRQATENLKEDLALAEACESPIVHCATADLSAVLSAIETTVSDASATDKGRA